jgi:hypothetical protein
VRTAVVVLALVGVTTVARAQAVQAPGKPDDFVGRDVVLPVDGGEASGTLEVNLTRRYESEPASVAPDLYYGVTRELTVGIIHSSRAMGVIDAGAGLCFRGETHECSAPYDNTGVDVRYAVRRGRIAIAARARVIASTYDPFKPSVRPGALVRFHLGRFGIVADPHVQLGLAHRDEGNRDWVRVPLWFAVQPLRGAMIALRTGVDGEVATFGDTYAIPIGVDVALRITDRVEAGAFVGFPTLGGPQNQFTRRVMWLGVTGRWK